MQQAVQHLVSLSPKGHAPAFGVLDSKHMDEVAGLINEIGVQRETACPLLVAWKNVVPSVRYEELWCGFFTHNVCLKFALDFS